MVQPYISAAPSAYSLVFFDMIPAQTSFRYRGKMWIKNLNTDFARDNDKVCCPMLPKDIVAITYATFANLFPNLVS